MRTTLDRCCAAINLTVVALLLASVSSTAAVAKKPDEEQAQTGNPGEAAVAKIQAALAHKTTLDYRKKPLGEVISEFAAAEKVNAVMDQKALEDASLGFLTPITFQAKGISWGAAFKLILEPLDCDVVIKDEVLQITTVDQSNTLLSTRVHPVRDLIVERNVFDEAVSDPEALIALISTTVHPTTWDEVGGPGAMGFADGALVVTQTDEVHEQLVDLLKTIRSVRDTSSDQLPTSAPSPEVLPSDAQRKTILAKRVTWDFDELPLVDLCTMLSKQLGMNVQLDTKALDEATVDSSTPVTIHLKDVSAASALKLMLRGMDLTYTFKHEVLMITTRDSGCSPSLYTRLYPVGDLVTDSEDRDAYEQLMAMVTATVDPTTWDEVGGPAAITVLPQARALVVSQSLETHDAIATVLESLRASQPAKPAVPQPTAMVTKVYDLSGRFGAPAAPPTAVPTTPVPTPKPAAPPAGAIPGVVAPAVGAPPLAGGGAAEPNAVCAVPPSAPAAASQPIDAFGKLVQEKLSPKTWGDQGGKLYVIGNKLIVTQSADVHRRIPRLIDAVFGPDLSQHGKKSVGGGGGGFFTVPAGQ